MREIKFRAWDKSLETMWLWNQSNRLETFFADMKETLISPLENFIQNPDRFELMQWTGLHDKNGKEIWEGDIVVKDEYIWFDKGKPNYRGTVEWIYSQWQVVAHCINPSKRGISDGINEGINDEGMEEGEKTQWEVIGNIYENPELLGEK